MWGWLLVFLIPGTAEIYLLEVPSKFICMEVGIALEDEYRKELKAYIPKGSTFECVKTV